MLCLNPFRVLSEPTIINKMAITVLEMQEGGQLQLVGVFASPSYTNK